MRSHQPENDNEYSQSEHSSNQRLHYINNLKETFEIFKNRKKVIDGLLKIYKRNLGIPLINRDEEVIGNQDFLIDDEDEDFFKIFAKLENIEKKLQTELDAIEKYISTLPPDCLIDDIKNFEKKIYDTFEKEIIIDRIRFVEKEIGEYVTRYRINDRDKKYFNINKYDFFHEILLDLGQAVFFSSDFVMDCIEKLGQSFSGNKSIDQSEIVRRLNLLRHQPSKEECGLMVKRAWEKIEYIDQKKSDYEDFSSQFSNKLLDLGKSRKEEYIIPQSPGVLAGWPRLIINTFIGYLDKLDWLGDYDKIYGERTDNARSVLGVLVGAGEDIVKYFPYYRHPDDKLTHGHELKKNPPQSAQPETLFSRALPKKSSFVVPSTIGKIKEKQQNFPDTNHPEYKDYAIQILTVKDAFDFVQELKSKSKNLGNKIDFSDIIKNIKNIKTEFLKNISILVDPLSTDDEKKTAHKAANIAMENIFPFYQKFAAILEKLLELSEDESFSKWLDLAYKDYFCRLEIIKIHQKRNKWDIGYDDLLKNYSTLDNLTTKLIGENDIFSEEIKRERDGIKDNLDEIRGWCPKTSRDIQLLSRTASEAYESRLNLQGHSAFDPPAEESKPAHPDGDNLEVPDISEIKLEQGYDKIKSDLKKLEIKIKHDAPIILRKRAIKEIINALFTQPDFWSSQKYHFLGIKIFDYWLGGEPSGVREIKAILKKWELEGESNIDKKLNNLDVNSCYLIISELGDAAQERLKQNYLFGARSSQTEEFYKQIVGIQASLKIETRDMPKYINNLKKFNKNYVSLSEPSTKYDVYPTLKK